MRYTLLIVVLSVGGLFCHFISSHSVRKVKNIYSLFPMNILLYFAFFSLYFFAVAQIESAIYGHSAEYDVEALIFLLFAIIFSVVSSAFHIRARKKQKKLEEEV